MSTTILDSERFAERPVAVLFDLDNTLYRYEPAHEAGMTAVRAKAARSVGAGREEFERAFAEARADTKAQLGSAASSHSRLLYFQRTLENLGLRSQVLLSLEFEQTYWRSYLSAVELREGVISFLDQLARAGIPKVIVTDLTAQVQFRKLVYLELDRLFEYVVTSEESGADKPDRSGFDIAMNKLSSPIGPVWMIGDNVITDLEGAKNAIDATTLALRSEIGDQTKNSSIDMIFDSFGDLERFVSARGWDNPSGE